SDTGSPCRRGGRCPLGGARCGLRTAWSLSGGLGREGRGLLERLEGHLSPLGAELRAVGEGLLLELRDLVDGGLGLLAAQLLGVEGVGPGDVLAGHLLPRVEELRERVERRERRESRERIELHGNLLAGCRALLRCTITTRDLKDRARDRQDFLLQRTRQPHN